MSTVSSLDTAATGPTPRAHRTGPLRRSWAAVFAVGLALLAACGGGTQQIEVFIPERLLVFGDDYSALNANGRQYSVNGLDTNGNLDCNAQPIWVQSVAGAYGFVFAECNPGAVSQPKARMLAAAGAKVSDIAAQVEAQVAAGGFRDKDLATVLGGFNDILELYQQYPTLAEATLLDEARARGARLARVVNRLVGLGVKVVISDLPDLGISPYALGQRTVGASFDRAALISRLTTAFNEQLGVNVVLDGRFVGLVQAQLRFQAIQRSPGSFGLANISQGVCLVSPPECTAATLQPDAVAGQYLWADDTRLGPGAHTQLATLAIDRAQRNPF